MGDSQIENSLNVDPTFERGRRGYIIATSRFHVQKIHRVLVNLETYNFLFISLLLTI